MIKKFVRFAMLLSIGVLVFSGIQSQTSYATKTTKIENKRMEKPAVSLEDKNVLVLSLDYGQVYIKLRPDLAPNHVKRIRKLADSGFYDGVLFHRVIDGFMAQTGDPTGTGTGGSGQHIKAEFNDGKFVRGTVGMARAQHEDSADSQFFITFKDSSFLNGQYTVFGQVIAGMDHVDKIKRGEPPADPDKVIWAKVITDAEAEMETELEEPDFIDGQLEPKRYQ